MSFLDYFKKNSIKFIRKRLRKRHSRSYDGYCIMCNSFLGIHEIIQEKKIKDYVEYISKCKKCKRLYLDKWWGVDEDTTRKTEKYLRLKKEWILLGITHNMNREAFGDKFRYEIPLIKQWGEE